MSYIEFKNVPTQDWPHQVHFHSTLVDADTIPIRRRPSDVFPHAGVYVCVAGHSRPRQGDTSASEWCLEWGFGLHVESRALDSRPSLGLLSDLIKDTSHDIWDAVRSPYDRSKPAAFSCLLKRTWGVEDFPCKGTARWQPVPWVVTVGIEDPREGDMGSDDRLSKAGMDGLQSDPSAAVSLDTLDVDSCSSDRAEGKLCSPKNFLSSSDSDEHSKLFIPRKK